MKTNQRKRWLIYGTVLVVSTVAALAFWVVFQPTYKGKTVGEWTASGGTAPPNEVVNAFGAGAAETLARILEEEEEDLLRRGVARLWPRFSPTMHQRLNRWAPGSLQAQQAYAEAWIAKLETGAEEVFPRLRALALKGRCRPRTLALVGREHPDAPAAFAEILGHAEAGRRSEAALAGATLGMRGVSVLPTLQNFLSTGQLTTVGIPVQAATNRVEPELVILGIGALGPAASNAVPALVNCLDQSKLVQPTLWALTEIGPGAAEAVPKLRERLSAAQQDEQLRIVKCLHAIGLGAAAAAPELSRLRTGETNLLQLLVCLALAEIKGKPELRREAMQKALAGRRHHSTQIWMISLPDFRGGGRYQGLNHAEYAALAAAEMEYDRDLLPYLEQAMDGRGGWRLQILATRAIWRQTGRMERILPAVWNGLFSDDHFCVETAIELLEEMPVGAGEMRVMQEFLKDFSRAWPHRMRVMQVIEASS